MQGADDRIIDAASSRQGTQAKTLCALLLACAVAAVFASAPIAAWTRDLPDTPLTARLQDTATQWDQTVSRFGAGRPYAWLHGFVRRIRPND